MPRRTPNEHTETGDVAMMRDANRWPCWPLLPLILTSPPEPQRNRTTKREVIL